MSFSVGSIKIAIKRTEDHTSHQPEICSRFPENASFSDFGLTVDTLSKTLLYGSLEIDTGVRNGSGAVDAAHLTQ